MHNTSIANMLYCKHSCNIAVCIAVYLYLFLYYRYDEEDERMKAISEGKDPGNSGIKDTAALLSNCTSSLDIKSLCDPNSSSSSGAITKTESKSQKPTNLVSPEVSPQPPPNIVRNT